MIRRLDATLMDQIQRTVLAEVHLPDGDVAREYGIELTDVVAALRAPSATQTAYREGGAPAPDDGR